MEDSNSIKRFSNWKTARTIVSTKIKFNINLGSNFSIDSFWRELLYRVIKNEIELFTLHINITQVLVDFKFTIKEILILKTENSTPFQKKFVIKKAVVYWVQAKISFFHIFVARKYEVFKVQSRWDIIDWLWVVFSLFFNICPKKLI